MINVELSSVAILKNYTQKERDIIVEKLTQINPAHQNAIKYGKWEHTRIPKYISYYTEYGDKLIVPRGFEIPFEYAVDYDDRLEVEVEYPKFKVKLWDTQREAVKAYLDTLKDKQEKGVIVLPTGKGKSLLGIYLAKHLRQKCLIIVQKDDLIDGWKKDINLALGLRPRQIGLIKARTFRIGEQFTLATIQTLSKLPDNVIGELVKTFGMVILDEEHRSAAKSYNMINEFHAKFRLGLTATPFRNDGLEDVLYYYFGKIAYEYKEQEDDEDIISAGNVLIKTIPIYNVTYKPERRFYLYKEKKEITESELKEYLPAFYKSASIDVAIKQNLFGKIKQLPLKAIERRKVVIYNDSFLRILIRYIVKEYNYRKSCIVFCHEVNQCELIFDLLLQEGVPVEDMQLFHGKSKSTKEEIKSRAESKEVLITIATFSIATEGTNVKAWERGFLAGSIANEKDLIQCIGRLRRRKENKEEIIIYDFWFPNVVGMQKHFNTRKSIYKKRGFVIV